MQIFQAKVSRAEREEKDKSRRFAAERWRRYIEDLRRQRQAEQDRRRRLMLILWLWMLDSTAAQAYAFAQAFSFAPDPAATPTPARPRKSEEETADVETLSDYDRHYLYDHRPRLGEEHQEVYDGLTWDDIVALNRIHRPHLSPKFAPIPGMPDRYRDEPVHVWTLLDHIDSDYHRPDAIAALKLITDENAHAWIDACAAEVDGLSHKDLRRQCRHRTPEKTIREFPRAAVRWREEQRREAEERKKEAKEIPDNGSKPSGVD